MTAAFGRFAVETLIWLKPLADQTLLMPKHPNQRRHVRCMTELG